MLRCTAESIFPVFERLPEAEKFIDNSRPIGTVQMAERHSGTDFYKKYLLNGSLQMYFCV